MAQARGVSGEAVRRGRTYWVWRGVRVPEPLTLKGAGAWWSGNQWSGPGWLIHFVMDTGFEDWADAVRRGRIEGLFLRATGLVRGDLEALERMCGGAGSVAARVNAWCAWMLVHGGEREGQTRNAEQGKREEMRDAAGG